MSETGQRPNVLLFITDQQRWDTLGYTGRTSCGTPNLDRLAREGVAFDRCISPNPLCCPARAALFTGRYAHAAGVGNNLQETLERPALPEVFRDAGYDVAYAGKWHLGRGRGAAALDTWPGERSEGYRQWIAEHNFADTSPAGQLPFTFNPDGQHRGRPLKMHRISTPYAAPQEGPTEWTYDSWIAARALEHLEDAGRRPRDRPFFHVCSLSGPHPVFAVPEPYYSLYDPAQVPEPPNFADPMEGKPAFQSRSLWREVAREHGETWEPWARTMAVYWGMVTLLDELIGRVLGRLESLGLAENTIVAMTTDHGELMGSHGLFQKRSMYEESLRVPLIVRAPGGRANTRITAPVSLTDIAPTLLGLAGLSEAGERLLAPQGRDLSGWVREGPPRVALDDPAAGAVFSENIVGTEDEGMTDIRGAIGPRFKLAWNRNDRHELYDTWADPYELDNLADYPALWQVRAALSRALLGWMRETGDPLADEAAASL